MWRSSVVSLGFKPAIGLKVLCEGRPSIYKQTGRLQMIVQKMQPAGEGLLQKKFLELKHRLQQEGLFDPSRKRSLPSFPKAIGVVTSGSGAVIHDIMVRIKDRMPFLQVYLVDVKVQGEGAAKEIADGIRLLNEQAIVDVIIVGRGGGSLEDLWAFNEEEVVRAIFASRIPVISSVGHETDIS
jgi:exodeoxyribonuclease VII large subunit